ncbi:DUF636 domain-containing protein [Gymnopilus junonius]|uniref:DUF636 domain-containing protein n=1 Tax=Gymnopilus junonius TaxID=109634 RepID=A0A9P5TPL7_GYMJU|nr:DUF636 domain-containing protein [Gymnopilus junonius]
MSAEKTYHASCLCSAVKFTLVGDPFHFVICNCRNCKKAAGSAFMANIMFKPEQVSFTQGEDTVSEFQDCNTISGRALTRTFCSKCGAQLFLIPAARNMLITHPSLIEEEVAWVPKKESHPHDRWSWVKEIAFHPKQKPKL